MEKITLRRANVVKEVLSEEAARALERKGFVRDGAAFGNTAPCDTAALKKQMEAAKDKAERYAGELKEARKKLEEADKRVRELSRELDGTREQLEAAVRKNAASAKKEKQAGGSGQ